MLETVLMLAILKTADIGGSAAPATLCDEIQYAVQRAHETRSGLKYYWVEPDGHMIEIIEVRCVRQDNGPWNEARTGAH